MKDVRFKTCDTPIKLLLRELQEVYAAENLMISFLPTLVTQAKSPRLKLALHHHYEETESHIRRVEQALANLDCKPERQRCSNLHSLIEECPKDEPSRVTDAALIEFARKVELYEISTYSHICFWAQKLELTVVSDLLLQNLAEELRTEAKLQNLAETGRDGLGRRGTWTIPYSRIRPRFATR